MKTSDFDYELPEELIAQHPAAQRDHSRLLVMDKYTGAVEHRVFRDIVDYLHAGDVLVLNNTKVIPARIFGVKEGGTAKIEVLLLKRDDDLPNTWEVLVHPGKRAKVGTVIDFGEGRLKGEVIANTSAGRKVTFHFDGIFEEILEELGTMPLPPYIHEQLEDQNRYQTVYAKVDGSAAAPTAGLHFTTELLETLRQNGIEIEEVLLHVGLGTFKPVSEEDIEDHEMHSEYYEISQETADRINKAKAEGRRIISVGTTSTRALESAAKDGRLQAGSGWTNIFIYPGYKWQIIDGLITNFHLPKSTLMMLVSALSTREHILAAYKEAVAQRYRFFSFGDAMFINPGDKK
ncbi:MAG: tRNA preQ1(34) S-adenosylmethionine ribosyltransferase-isomerase QueA [Peptococcaceae bacterium]|nr:tRNA preQ1(34) S-adenosylmethionine ribosyltransferase-isomerase QueA [Peptococcaceae bacterium]